MGILIFTARKRSLGLDNIFTRICLSTGEGVLPDRDPPEPTLNRDTPDRDPPGQRPPGQRPLYGKEQAVRILLECILAIISKWAPLSDDLFM